MKYLFLFISLIFLFSCSFNKTEQSKGDSFLQGEWAEDSVENKAQLVSYEQNYFTFKCDSFYLNIKTFSKVNLNGGACYDKNSWQEFAKGYYTVVKDTLKLEGSYVDEAYKYKTQNSCYRNGIYQEDFIMQKQGEQILLRSLKTSLYHQLDLKKKLVCEN